MKEGKKMSKRIKKVVERISEKELDGLLLVKNEKLIRENVRYITGFTGDTAYVVITPQRRILILDDRYIDQAKEQCPEFEIIRYDRPFTKKLREVVEELNIRKLGVEFNGLTMDMFKTIKDALSEIELVDSNGIIESLRAVKDKEEIKLIEEASRIAGKAYKHILDFFKVGVREKDIALEFEFFMRKSGADGLAFDTILVSGERTTHQHGAPSEKKINNGDFIIIDFGALYEGYRCDITRTFVVGQATAKQKDIYYTVKKAQQKGLDLLKAGVRGKDVCVEARKIIEDAGYGDYTGYGLGHGVGLEVHEDPYFRSYGELVFEEGHVVTVEPGIYISGWGGVRIEDTVVIEKNGCKVLTNLPKDLIELNA